MQHSEEQLLLKDIASAGEVTVQYGGSKILGWEFSINNVLTWTADGTSVWLQFLVTPDGPVILGNVSTTGEGPGKESCVHVWSGFFCYV